MTFKKNKMFCTRKMRCWACQNDNFQEKSEVGYAMVERTIHELME